MRWLAINFHLTAGLLHEAINLAQAQTGALPCLFGGKERFKDAVENISRHAMTGIAYAQDDVLTSSELRVRPRMVLSIEVFRASTVSLPPSGIASLALIARLRSAGSPKMVRINLYEP